MRSARKEIAKGRLKNDSACIEKEENAENDPKTCVNSLKKGENDPKKHANSFRNGENDPKKRRKNRLIYLDNAATSFPKPKTVLDEVRESIASYGGNPGRGASILSLRALETVTQCREELASLIGLPCPERVIFTPSCTFGLNLIIKGLLRRGDHALISDMEHNSVLRPLEKLRREGVTYDVFPAMSKPQMSDEELLLGIERRIRPNTRLLICTHQSNITSYSLPVEKIGALCKKYNVLFALDGAQSVGHYNIDMQKMNMDFLAAPSHKGLYGILGAGFVAMNSNILPDTLTEGGNGIGSLEYSMGYSLPERYEAGSLPLPPIASLLAGVRFVKSLGVDRIASRERELFRYLRDRLSELEQIDLYLPEREGNTLLFNVKGIPVSRLASELSDEGICARCGFHCTALGHRALQTDKSGACRVSLGFFNTKSDLDCLLSFLKKYKKP